MQSYSCKSPVAFRIFNRPDETRQVFAEIAKARPPKLLVVADGPRKHLPNEVGYCEEARRIATQIDWNCELMTNFSTENLGCAERVSTGIGWVFKQVDEAIILEDDCLPHPTFFRFCDEMLETFRDDERIMSISGDNFQFGRKRWRYSYYFSRYVHIWGWASWKRAWKHYELKMPLWPTVKAEGWLNDMFPDRREARYWDYIFEQTYEGKTDTWDYQWLFACWLRSALSVVPNVNLISNIGFGRDATHTVGGGKFANMITDAMSFPLTHPPIQVRDSKADRSTSQLFFQRSLLSRAKTLAMATLKV